MIHVVSVLIALWILFPFELSAQAHKPMTISELVTYTGKDREAVLYAGAKNYGFKKWRPEHDMPLDKYEKELERWEKLLRETGRRGA